MEVLTKDVNVNRIENEEFRFLTIYKLKDSNHNLELRLRIYEENSDLLTCTLIPHNKPKTAYIIDIPIKSLVLHKKLDTEGDAWERTCVKEFCSLDEKVLNTLVIKGSYNASELNQILSSIIPEIPEKTVKDAIKYYFQSTYLNTVIGIEIENNFCIIKSMFLSPLMTIKV